MIQQNEKSTQNYIGPIWDGSSVSTKVCEKHEIRNCDYKNHRIFALRCINKGIIPVSIRLKPSSGEKRLEKLSGNQKGTFFKLG